MEPLELEPDGGWERLGESEGFGWVLLELLERAGWKVHVRAALGEGVLVSASHPELVDFDLRAEGRSVAEVMAGGLFERCVSYIKLRAPAQLRIPSIH